MQTQKRRNEKRRNGNGAETEPQNDGPNITPLIEKARRSCNGEGWWVVAAVLDGEGRTVAVRGRPRPGYWRWLSMLSW